ncbi:predicted protein [Histoplasma mississippiense (nom. inval.)]|uniref:predicted protein n=1 Tax=Ajellomyces capsulatus (strain NAm1 / WU24) TaxID=2059318 RepID=UPI000157CC9C|nr:predicted protein [Histoplasma mississippiense (nom. inval.)]EDN10103.1 predicted protein [Histoplasma mississippiense (nom. inval.)]
MAKEGKQDDGRSQDEDLGPKLTGQKGKNHPRSGARCLGPLRRARFQVSLPFVFVLIQPCFWPSVHSFFDIPAIGRSPSFILALVSTYYPMLSASMTSPAPFRLIHKGIRSLDRVAIAMAIMDQMGFTPFRRDEILQPRDFRTTFSTWENCMAKAYCKWPVVIGIAIGSIILIGVIWGIIACACCGYTCCKGCCACCSCCCPSRDKSHNRTKFADEPSAYNARNRRHSTGYQRPPSPPVYDSHHSTPAKFAQFDTVHPRSKSNDDALPQMPTWDSAKTRRVEEVSPPSDVEMNRLDPATGQNFKPQSFSRPVRYNNNTNSGGNSYSDRTPTSSAYSPNLRRLPRPRSYYSPVPLPFPQEALSGHG